MNDKERLMDLALDLQKLIASQKTLLLATATWDGIPDIGYAPYVRNPEGHFFIFISELAAHTANLLDNPKASVMLVRPEFESQNLFARERAIYQCSVLEIARNEKTYDRQLQAMQNNFGQVVTLLRSLDDFHLFDLCPLDGRYISGFGRAFRINVGDGSVGPILQKK